MERILVIDESRESQEILRTYFRDLYEIKFAPPEKAAENFALFQPQILIFSLEKLFPIKHILESLRNLPHESEFTTICFVSDANPNTLEFLFNCQIDDWLIRPIDFAQLYWKTKIHLRRMTSSLIKVNEVLQLGPLIVNVRTSTVKTPTQEVHVSDIQMRILIAMHAFPDRLLTRDWMQKKIWNNEPISLRSIDAQISKIKKLLPELEPLVENVYGKGYIYKKASVTKTEAS